MTIIDLRKRRAISSPRMDTAVKAPPAPGAPTFESNLVESLAIKRFLEFALADIKFQMKMMASDPRLAKKHFNENKQAAILIAEYVIGLIKDMDASLPTPQSILPPSA